MSPVVLDLTLEQCEKVAPFLHKLAEMAKEGKPGMLVAQVFDDHMKIGIVNHDKARVLSKEPDKLISEAPGRCFT